MKPKDNPEPAVANPAELAREAFRQLAVRKMAPTPDAYRQVYEEIAGTGAGPSAENTLIQFASALHLLATELDDINGFGKRFELAASARDWTAYTSALSALTTAHLTRFDRTQAAPAAIAVASVVPDDRQPRLLRDLLSRTLLLAVAALLSTSPELADEAELLGRAVKDAQSEDSLDEIGIRLRQLCFKIEMRAGDVAEEQELLLRLFRLLLENISGLTEEDSWLHGQIDSVHQLLSGPINHHALQDATRDMKDVIYKQGTLRHSLTEAKVTVKNMMITFIDRLGVLATSTGDYHEKIDAYSQKISQASDITTLNAILEDVMRDTRQAQYDALQSRDDMIVARQAGEAAEQRIHDLESQLAAMSELVREDQLTGSLNRRGLDDVFDRELARADRRKSPLCIAMLDLDDFKRLNDTHGHVAGDEALVYLVRVIKDTLRTMDVLARFGGEEFLILLPDTTMDAATQTVTRLQRELTKRIFMHNNERILITFSAGVALRKGNEDQVGMLKRADTALYQAKRAGKNRVVSAE
ncbi:GGDEF domain-containing protein [Actimicrobium sp. CCC2.4]|uniref:GGDEF domain-containing protein n=1 Tax=Actimicrobium sp. CCC2.4 TaxID=3048606 RepID=UPI002AC9E6F8|nr:GGDEF domain-containing protein [Actimicrobium sp. CCC2.4]MEB0133756.1 GGDEF domain-containing protein [Actimicrobium sp. CCC2.4]WPX31301.1 GGDEF domain-containing protein [Actimicrobium sp. CCC2.4]